MQNGARRALFELVQHDRELGIAFRDVPGRELKYPWHFHPELELTHIVKGSGVRYVADSIQPFFDDDLCLVGSRTPHCWLTEVGRQEPIHARVIQFLPDSITHAMGASPTFRPLVELFGRAQRGLRIHGATHRRTAQTIERLFEKDVRPLDRFVGLLSILSDLSQSSELEELGLAEEPTPSTALSSELATRIVSYVRDHAADPDLSFSSVARSVGMSRASLGRSFPRLFGKTFVKYLSEVRVMQACALLGETRRSVADIAQSTGFGSLSNFNRQFRSLKHTTPLAYRKSTSLRERRG